MNRKGKTAFCFPGQLRDRVILQDGHPLQKDSYFREWTEKASRLTQFDLLQFSFKGEDEEDIGLNLKLQISTYLLSMIHFYRLRAAGWVPDVLAEHSMGIYAALAASEASLLKKASSSPNPSEGFSKERDPCTGVVWPASSG